MDLVSLTSKVQFDEAIFSTLAEIALVRCVNPKLRELDALTTEEEVTNAVHTALNNSA